LVFYEKIISCCRIYNINNNSSNGLYFILNPPVKKQSLCDMLATGFDFSNNDNQLKINNNIEIGGILLNLSYGDYENETKVYSYYLTFKGKENEKSIWLVSNSQKVLPYEIGKFYQINTNNYRLNGMLNGSFIDDSNDTLIEVDCEIK
jgi:hypothetical protein